MKKIEIILFLLCCLFLVQKKSEAQEKTTSINSPVKIAIPFNNCISNTTLKAGPGFSAWIEFKGKIIVFDTGSNYQMLLENMMQMGLNFQRVTDIFISHNHWDHVYGIPGIAGVSGFNVNTFIPESSVAAIIEQVPQLAYTAVDSIKEIYPKIWTTGQLKTKFRNNTISEQSLILEQDDGLVVITGCSHPGIENIVKNINDNFPGKSIKLLVGGFHLENKSLDEIKQISENLKQTGVKSIAPSHCTGDLAIEYFRKDWGDNFVQLFLGDSYIIEKNYKP